MIGFTHTSPSPTTPSRPENRKLCLHILFVSVFGQNSLITAIEISQEYDNIIGKTAVEFELWKQALEGEEESQDKEAFKAIEIIQINKYSF